MRRTIFLRVDSIRFHAAGGKPALPPTRQKLKCRRWIIQSMTRRDPSRKSSRPRWSRSSRALPGCGRRSGRRGRGTPLAAPPAVVRRHLPEHVVGGDADRGPAGGLAGGLGGRTPLCGPADDDFAVPRDGPFPSGPPLRRLRQPALLHPHSCPAVRHPRRGDRHGTADRRPQGAVRHRHHRAAGRAGADPDLLRPRPVPDGAEGHPGRRSSAANCRSAARCCFGRFAPGGSARCRPTSPSTWACCTRWRSPVGSGCSSPR